MHTQAYVYSWYPVQTNSKIDSAVHITHLCIHIDIYITIATKKEAFNWRVGVAGREWRENTPGRWLGESDIILFQLQTHFGEVLIVFPSLKKTNFLLIDINQHFIVVLLFEVQSTLALLIPLPYHWEWQSDASLLLVVSYCLVIALLAK